MDFGNWMKINGEGIYNSHVLAPYKEDNICMTANPEGNAYFFYLGKDKEASLPSEVTIKSHRPATGAVVTLLGTQEPLAWIPEVVGFKVMIPEQIRKNLPCQHVWTIKVSQIE